MNQQVIKDFEQEQIQKAVENKEIPNFQAGDTVRISVKIKDGNNQRIQNYEGVVIGKSNAGLSSSFVVRKISHGEGVERRFMTYSPNISEIKLVKQGVVRRAKLFYLRGLKGKKAKIKEKTRK